MHHRHLGAIRQAARAWRGSPARPGRGEVDTRRLSSVRPHRPRWGVRAWTRHASWVNVQVRITLSRPGRGEGPGEVPYVWRATTPISTVTRSPQGRREASPRSTHGSVVPSAAHASLRQAEAMSLALALTLLFLGVFAVLLVSIHRHRCPYGKG